MYRPLIASHVDAKTGDASPVSKSGSKRTIESRAKSSINLNRTHFQYAYCFIHREKYDNIFRVLRIILVVLPEHSSDKQFFTMTMEILLERTSLKLLVGDMWDPCWIYPSWINDQVTTGKQQWGDSILNQTCSRIWIDGYFCKTFQCANLPSFKHIDCVFFLKTKVLLMEMWLKCKTLDVSKNVYQETREWFL